MRNQRTLLLATGEPFLEAELAEMPGVVVECPGCEIATDCLEQVAAHTPAVVVLSQATAPWPGALAGLAGELRVRHPQMEVVVLAQPDQLLAGEVEGLQQAGAHLLVTAGLTRDALAGWLRRQVSPAPAPPAPAPPAAVPPQATLPPRTTTAPAAHPASPLFARRAPGPPRPPADPRTQAPGPRVQLFGPRPPAPPAAHAAGAARLQPRLPPARGTQAPPPPPPQVLRQRVVAFWGGKGGAGRSTLVAAVADLVSRIPGVRVCTVDLNLANSSLAALVNKDAEPNSWLALGEAILAGSLTPQAVRASLVPVRPQWSLLSGPSGSDHWCKLVTPEVVTELVEHLRADFDYILLDLAAGRTPAGDVALALAQQVLVVVSAFFPDVVDTTRAFERALADGLLARDRCRLVLSQWLDAPELQVDDVSNCLNLPVAAVVPLAPAGALAAARTGSPVTQVSLPEAKPLADAAAQVAGLVAAGAAVPAGAAAGERPRRGWFGK